MAKLALDDGTEVVLGPPKPRGYGAKDSRRYVVSVAGTAIGTVESWRSESWRKHGRIRTSLIGRPKYWASERPGARYVHRHDYTRLRAIESLVAAWRKDQDEPHPDCEGPANDHGHHGGDPDCTCRELKAADGRARRSA